MPETPITEALPPPEDNRTAVDGAPWRKAVARRLLRLSRRAHEIDRDSPTKEASHVS